MLTTKKRANLSPIGWVYKDIGLMLNTRFILIFVAIMFCTMFCRRVAFLGILEERGRVSGEEDEDVGCHVYKGIYQYG